MSHISKAEESRRTSRRNFLKSSALAMTVAPLGTGGSLSYVHAAGSDTIRIGLVGCGGRGTGAAINAMSADKGTKLVAMADLIMDRVKKGRTSLQQKKSEQVAVDDDHCFSGFDGYKKVIESSDVVLIANAAKFHPLHLRTAIEAGKHVFVEKPHAIDPAGIKAVREACDLAKKKNLCVVSGLQSRHHLGYREAIQRVHDGAIGDIIAIEENFLRAPYVLYERQPGMTEVEYQGSNQYHFHWLSGDDIPQSLVHNVDRASWALHDQAPVKAHGMGGRSTLQGEIYGNVFDHHAVVYEFASGVRMYAFCRTIPGCYNDSSSTLLGSKGRCNVTKARIEGETNWHYEGSNLDPYLIEHQKLFEALRSGKVINDGEHMTRSTLIAIMGQISCYSGKELTWEQISSSDFYFAPKAEECRIDMEPPTRPGAGGTYPLPFTPGVTQLL